MRIVVALGGNALLQRGERTDAYIQIGHVKTAAAALAPLAAVHEVLLCHGNGPQVGMLALESVNDPELTRSYPLDDLVAQTQGMIGYWLTQALLNEGVTKPVLALVTQTLVDAGDPAFAAPTKFIGRGYSAAEADDLKTRNGWHFAADADQLRRVVASPEPVRLVEQASVDSLLDAGCVVIAGGGGGAVVTSVEGRLTGVEAVVDKDLLAAMLAIHVHADRLLIFTDVPAVMDDFGTPKARAINSLTLSQLAARSFPTGSMAPKVEACRRFVSETGRAATIGALSEADRVVAGTAGTTIKGDSGS